VAPGVGHRQPRAPRNELRGTMPIREWIVRVLAIGRRGRRDQELGDELEFHFESLVDAYERRGFSRQDARERAGRELGGLDRTRQAWRDQRTWLPAEELRQDFTVGWRVLRRSVSFTLPAVLTLALAVAATTSVFTVVDAVLLAPLPYGKPDQLVAVSEIFAPQRARSGVAPGNFLEWQSRTRTLSALTAIDVRQQNLTRDGEPQQVSVAAVSEGFTATAGVQPVLGRSFAADEFQPGRDGVAILSHTLWRTRYNGDRRLVGRTMVLDDRAYEIVGVMPAGFFFPNPDNELWTPLVFRAEDRENRTGHTLSVMGRLHDATTLDAARRDMDAIATTLQREFPASNRDYGISLRAARDAMVGDTKPVLAAIAIAVLLLLLVACANIAGLMLTHGASRDREVAVRLALGASRPRVIRQFLSESVLLSLAGGALGLVLAVLARPLVAALRPEDLVAWKTIAVDTRAAVFAAAVSVIAGVLFGLLPAFLLSESRIGQRASTRGAGRDASRARLTLVTFEVALSVVLVCGAGVLARTLERLTAVNLGFEPRGVVTMRLSVPETRYREDQQVRAVYDQTLERIRALPGVQAAGAIHMLPLSGDSTVRPYRLAGQSVVDARDLPLAHYRIVTEGYLEAMRVPLRAGRLFDRGDQPNRPLVVVINEALRRRDWGDRDPLGARVTFGGVDEVWATIVGVIGDIHHFGPMESAPAEMYWPAPQIDATPSQTLRRLRRNSTLVVRADSHPLAIVPSIRAAVQAVDADQPIASVRTMPSLVSATLWLSRTSAWIVSVFGTAALMFALLGVFATVSYAVSQRRRELAVRVALGASASSVTRTVLRGALWASGVGVGAGFLAALGLQATLSSWIAGTEALSLWMFVAIVGGCAAFVLLACWLPAKQASRVELMQVLRTE